MNRRIDHSNSHLLRDDLTGGHLQGDDLLHHAAEHGLDHGMLAEPLARLGAAAVLDGVSATLLGLVGDRTQPEVARLRALARIVGALDASAPARAPRAADQPAAAAC